MGIIFRRLRDPQAAATLLQAKYLQIVRDPTLADELARHDLARRDTAEPPLLGEHELGALSGGQLQHLQQVKKQHLAVFRRTHALLQGETLEQVSSAVLAEAWRDYPKGTAVVVRDTSACREYHFFPYIRFDDGEIRVDEPLPARPAPKDHPRLLMLLAPTPASDKFADLAEQLGTGLVKSALGMAAGALFQALFPPGAPAWVNELYVEVRRIVHDEIEQARLGVIQGQLNAAAQHVSDYRHFRKKEKLDSCLPHLLKAHEILVDAKGQLQQIGDAGIYIYCIATGQLMLVLQELACNDPDYLGRPLDSPWTDVIQSDVAPGAVKVAEATYQHIIETRLARITPVKGWIMPRGHWTFDCVDNETGQRFTGRGGGHCYDDEYKIKNGDTERQRAVHCNEVLEGLKTRLKGVQVSIDAWKTLRTDPLGRIAVKPKSVEDAAA